MKHITIMMLAVASVAVVAGKAQVNEKDRFYSHYPTTASERIKCDSVFQLVEKRRTAFSKAFRAHKAAYGNLSSFSYDWQADGKLIEQSLDHSMPIPLRDLVYYSYFDISYGVFGYTIQKNYALKALTTIPTTSVIWALEPSLLINVIVAAGGEDQHRAFIEQLLLNNTDEGLRKFIKGNLSEDRVLKIGKDFPALIYRTLSDSTHIKSSADFKGKYLLIDIWATWCAPCIEEFPNLIAAYTQRKDQVDFMSISIDAKTEVVLKFFKTKSELPWENGLAVKGKGVLSQLGVNGIPLSVLISPDGKILAYGNELRGRRLSQTINKFLP